MLRVALFTITVVSIIWMAWPGWHDEATEMAFTPGTPDPNVYKTTYLLGWPLPWIGWARAWNEAAGYDELSMESFSFFNFVIHVFAITAPMLAYLHWRDDNSRRPDQGAKRRRSGNESS